jgi:WD40 repeat protein/serine/threonine protein kinase
MTASRLNNEAMFHAARDIADPDRRRQYVRAACGADESRIAHLEALLAAADAPDSLLDHPVGNGAQATLDPPTTESNGTAIGPYKLLEQIGEGGMGTVWMAQQTEPVKRVVALKLIKAGMDSKQVIARFEAERQALALMDHASIARVLDAGTTSAGRPFFVMDLVKGVPITRYCDEHHLTPRQRLQLFIPVCQAIQHAHQKGVIHRDLKPSNVLIALYDGKPVPKVIDFGVAKAAGQALTERTLVTGFGSIVGTLEYMSPEQAEMNQLDIDTRSDIYSLGVLLYELLTGGPPFTRKQLQQSGVLEMLRVIREQEPTKPSTKLSTAEGLPTLAANRGTEPARLTRLVRGELDWIVMKALEKDRARRYETANAFAMDIHRYLADEPVMACPPSVGYRLRKFARRNKRVAVAASFVFALLVVAVGALAAGYARVQRSLEREKETTYLQRTALAGRELAAGNVGHAEELLDACPEHLRGWEWHFLKRQRYDGEPAPIRHSATVYNVALSPDDRQLATVCMDGTIAIRDARTGRILHTLEQPMALGPSVQVRGLAYSTDGRYLALARQDGIVRVWDAPRAQPLPAPQRHKGAAWKVAFSPDSRFLASGGADGAVRLWDMTSGKSLGMFPEHLPDHPAVVKGVAFRPDGRSVLAAYEDGTVKAWDWDTRRPTFSFRGELRYPMSASFSPDARRLAWSSFDGVLKVWDTTTGQLEINQQTNTWQLRSVAFTPDGQRMALACFDGTVRILDMAGREMLTIFAHSSIAARAVFNRDGTKIASASYDHTVRIWDATRLEPDPQAGYCVTLTGHKALVTGVAFSPDGRWLASASWDGTVKLWEAGASGTPEGTPRYTLRGHSGNVTSVAFSADNRTLASGSWDKTVKLWDLQAPVGDSLAELGTIPCTPWALSIAFSPDGRLLAIGQGNGIGLYDSGTRKEVAPFKQTPAPVPAVAFSRDSRRLVSAGASDPTIKVWDVAGAKPLIEIAYDPTLNGTAAISPDSRLIASSGPLQAAAGPTVKIWEIDWSAKTYKDFRTLSGHSGYVFKVAFSPDGRYLASGSWDAIIKVWDLNALAHDPTAQPATLRGHAGPIYGLTFSPDSRRLASASGYADHGEVKVWDASLWEDTASGGGPNVANTGQRKQVD